MAISLRRIVIFFFVQLILFAFLSCKKSGSNSQGLLMFLLGQQSNSVSSNTGGTVGVGPEVALSVPAGALEVNTTITTDRIPPPPTQEHIVPLQAAYSFGPEDLQFLAPATLQICYNPDELTSKNVSEDTVQIFYHNPQNGELTSVGGIVDPNTHCVSAEIHHFSTYLAAAIALVPGNNPPVIGGATFLPSTPLVGMPLRVSTTVTEFAADGSGAISSVYLYYRFGAAGIFTKVPMQPDSLVTGSQTYYYTIPYTQMISGTLQYYIEATDNLGAKRKRPATAPTTPSSIAVTATVNAAIPLRIAPTTNPFNMTAGFSRDFTTQVRRSTGAYLNIAPSSFGISGGIGTGTQVGTSFIRLLAQTKGTGSVDFTAGPYSVSKPVNVSAGQLQKIEILDSAGVIITSLINIKAGNTYSFDVLGYDAYGNNMVVLASLTVTGGLGSVAADGTFTASGAYPQSGTLTADFDGFSDSITINITNPNPPAAAPVFSPAPGAYNSDQSVTLTSLTPGAILYYTTDGTDPTTGSTVYSGPINVTGDGTNVTIKAISVAPPYQDSAISSGTYTITYLPAATPNFSPGSGTYSSAQFITMTSATSGATIYYTIDGSTPTIWSPVYSGPLLLTSTATLKAIAVKAGMLNSSVQSGNYTINDTTAPTVIATTPASGATNVSPFGATITVTFSEPMNTSLTPTLATVDAGGGGTIPNTGTTFAWTSSNTLTITLSWIRFPENTQIQWTLGAAGLQDWAGHQVAANVQQSFTTGLFTPAVWPIADTGQTACYNETAQQPCGNPSYPDQDGDFVDAPNARSFTGPAAHPLYTNDYTTTDNVTGLLWASCSNGQSGADCSTGTASTAGWSSAMNACASMNSTNSGAGYAGRKDWRLPTIKELQTLHNFSGVNPAIETANFPTAVGSWYWTSTSYIFAPHSNRAIAVSFANTWTSDWPVKTSNYYIRCVANSRSPSAGSPFIDNGDGTISDSSTNLRWQKCTAGLSGSSCGTGSPTYFYTRQNVLKYCNSLALGGKSWRLPSVNEIETLSDFSQTIPPFIDTTVFPVTAAWGYATSSSWGTGNMWSAYYATGTIMNSMPLPPTGSPYTHVRCVTTGP